VNWDSSTLNWSLLIYKSTGEVVSGNGLLIFYHGYRIMAMVAQNLFRRKGETGWEKVFQMVGSWFCDSYHRYIGQV